MTRTPNSKIVAMIPSGRQYIWSPFYADTFHALWSDGKIGGRDTRHTPIPNQLNEIRVSIPIAIKKCEKYIEELKGAKKLLSTPKQKRAQARMSKLVEIEKYEHDDKNA